MTVELVTGYAGAAHVTSADDGWKNAGLVGVDNYVLETGAQLVCNVSSNTAVTIGTGDVIMQGRHIRVQAQETVTIDNGAQGVNRNDIICLKYERNTSTGIETASLEVVKGTATSGTPTDPTIPSGNILENANTAYMPLWRIPITGINAGTPVQLFGVLPSLSDVALGDIDAGRISGTLSATNIPGLSAGKITSGTLNAARIPNLDASKIASGTLDAARIPNLPASKITSGALAAARGGTGVSSASANQVFAAPSSSSGTPGFRALVAGDIPDLDASKVSSGTLNAARIPNIDASKIATGQLALSRMPFDILYDNANGETENFTMNASVAGYTYVEVLYRSTSDNIWNSVKVYSPDGKEAQMLSCRINEYGQVYLKSKVIKFVGAKIQQSGYAGYVLLNNGTYTPENGFAIHRVIGWK